MKRINATIQMELMSDVIFSSGNSIPGGADITLRTDALGRPYVPGSTIKGLLRETIGNYLCWTKTGTQADLDALMGCRGVRSVESERRLIFGDLHLVDRTLTQEDCAYLRTFTRLKNGVAAHGSLHTALCLSRGYILTGQVICAEADRDLLEKGLQLIQSVGLKRSRGFGTVRITLGDFTEVRCDRPVPEGNWIHYKLRAHTPLTLSDGTSAPTDADRKNYTDSKDHIPGSAIRGLVMSHLASQDPDWFESHKQTLLQQVLFRNALPLSGGHRQIPTPLGFYEDRRRTHFYHVLNQDVESGHKRARLGRYCRFQDQVLVHSSPAMESALRITATDPDTRSPLDSNERQMFTGEAISAGTELEGWIYTPYPALAPHIAAAFQNWICIGADRYCGSGLCSVETLDGEAPDYRDFAYGPGDDTAQVLYLLMVSPTAMLRDGEVSSLTDGDLAKLLGVDKASIERYATTIIRHSGFNRKWGCALPTVNMYAPGSIFRIECSEAPALDRLLELQTRGIGIRRTEGCGQVLFLRGFDRLDRHSKPGSYGGGHSGSSQELIRRRRARCRWLMNNGIQGNLSSAQRGDLQSHCRNVLHGKMGLEKLYAFFDTKIAQKTQDTADYRRAKSQFCAILDTPLHKTLGCAFFGDSVMERLSLYCDLFDMDRKESNQ